MKQEKSVNQKTTFKMVFDVLLHILHFSLKSFEDAASIGALQSWKVQSREGLTVCSVGKAMSVFGAQHGIEVVRQRWEDGWGGLGDEQELAGGLCVQGFL
jgi:hypothetical protein